MRRVLLAGAAAAVCLPIGADAATPRPRAMLEAHRHHTGGHDWHVQLEVNRGSDRLTTVVVWSQRCGRTGFLQGSALGPHGSFAMDAPLQEGSGRWSLRGYFADADHAVGTWAVSTPDCTDGGTFRAHDATGHFLLGNPFEYPAKAANGTSPDARRMRRLKLDSRRNASRFRTIAMARRQGYEFSATASGCPGFRHARKHGTKMWGRVLDASAPQALVYWCDSHGRWTLAAFMYRAGNRTRPETFGGMIQWHKHGPTAAWMTHLWLVRDPLSAFATCAPFREFAAEARFSYEPYKHDETVNNPCSDTPGLRPTTRPAPPQSS